MIEARELVVYYENMIALNNVTLSCGSEEVVGVFGANSAGKSTLMRVLSGIILDHEKKEAMRGGERISVFGEVLHEGEPIQGLAASDRARRGIVLCPERRRLFAESSVRDNLRMGGWLARPAQARATYAWCLELFPVLAGLLRRPAGYLSGGEQQMVAISRALMAQPRVLLLDEPLLGLAPAVQKVVAAAIPRIRSERGIAILVTEQYARPLLPAVDKGYILENGALVLEGTREELMNDPDVKSAYFGT